MEEDRMAEVLPALMRDRAADFWEELPEDTQKSYNFTKAALLEHFLPPEARRMYYTDLHNRVQGQEEPVADFGRAIQDMTRRAHSTMSNEDQDILCREHFLHGLHPNLKRLVLVANPKSFTDAVAAAKREEYNDQIVSGSAPWLKQPGQQESMMNRPVSQVSINALSRPGVAPVHPGVEGDLLRQMKDLMVSQQQMLTCLREEIRGHNNRPNRYQSNNCGARFRPNQNARVRTDNMSTQKSPGRNLRTTDGQVICNKCHRVGHIARLCLDSSSISENSKTMML